MITCSPLSALKDLKVPIKEGVAKLCTLDQVHASYESLRFFAAPGEPSTTGLFLLVGVQTTCVAHMILRDVLLC